MDDAKVEKQSDFGNGGERNDLKKFSFCKLSGLNWEELESWVGRDESFGGWV